MNLKKIYLDSSNQQIFHSVLWRCLDADFCHSVQGSSLIARVKRPPRVCSRTSGIQVHLYYLCLTNFRGHIQNRVLSVYARGCNPSSLPPQVRQYGQFSHISTCIIFCTSHNWSMTVTSCIRCFSIYFLHRFYVINGT